MGSQTGKSEPIKREHILGALAQEAACASLTCSLDCCARTSAIFWLAVPSPYGLCVKDMAL